MQAVCQTSAAIAHPSACAHRQARCSLRYELASGFYTMIDEHLAVPFETTLLGIPVTVRGVDFTERAEIVAICSRGRLRQAIPILDLVLRSPAPAGAEWIEAYRHWARGG